MKDEFKGKIIIEFIGLKSKMYSVIAVDNEEVKKAKGVNKNIATLLCLIVGGWVCVWGGRIKYTRWENYQDFLKWGVGVFFSHSFIIIK